jgi:hypothetical protein
MSDQKESFGRTAEKLSRNPLGIIALFIVLAHAFASMILAFSNRLQNGQQWPLIIFVVLFPLIVLSIFTYLVIKHHIKLYAPADFRSDESFLKSISPEQLKSENVTIGSEITVKETKASIDLFTDAAIAIDTENTNGDKNKDSDRSSSEMIHSSEYLIAADLALRRIEASFNEPVRRQAVVTAFDGNIRFDGIIIQDDLVTGVGVLFFKNINRISIDILEGRFSTARKASNYLVSIGRRFNFILVIVVDDERTSGLRYESHRKSLEQLILDKITNKSLVKTQVQVLDFGLLKEEFSVT